MLTILLDMDEVLADFVGGMCREWGADPAEVIRAWEPGVWGTSPALSRVIGVDPHLTNEQMLDKVRGREEFWAGLGPTPWAGELLDAVRSLTDEWYVVSAPTDCGACHSGKVKWLRRYFGPSFDRFALTPRKEILARPNSLLLDDSDENVRRFAAAGGRAVVFPRVHNRLAGMAADPLAYCLPVLRAAARAASRSKR
jgi:5'(3')-deoxyribonucleotidase